MLALMFSRTGAAVAGVVMAMLIAVWAVTAAYQAGAAAERLTTLNRSVEVLRERNTTDDQIRNLDDAGLCAALGGQWMPDDGTCQ